MIVTVRITPYHQIKNPSIPKPTVEAQRPCFYTVLRCIKMHTWKISKTQIYCFTVNQLKMNPNTGMAWHGKRTLRMGGLKPDKQLRRIKTEQ